jgi:hypothetical protein
MRLVSAGVSELQKRYVSEKGVGGRERIGGQLVCNVGALVSVA